MTARFRRIAKVLGWIAISIVGLGIVLYAVLVAVNWRDREPSPAALRFAQLFRDRPAVSTEDNAYVYAMGFEVAPGEDPGSMGAKRVAWVESADLSRPSVLEQDPLVKEPGKFRLGRNPEIEKFLAACRPGKGNCAAAFDADNPELESWINSQGWLLERYRSLIARKGWREPAPNWVTPIPAYGLLMDGQKLLMLKAKTLAVQNHPQEVRELLASDIVFWRMAMESADTLISKMMSIAALRRHFTLGNMVLRKLPREIATSAVPPQWREPISDRERSLLRCMVGEWVFSSNYLRKYGDLFSMDSFEVVDEDPPNLDRIRARLGQPLYQPQDTINEYAEYFLRTVELLDAPLSGYEASAKRAADFADRGGMREPSIYSVYNLVGQPVLRMMAGLDYSTYGVRVSDTEGVRRAALAAVTLREQGIPSRDVSAALAGLPPSLHNPYDNEALKWRENDGAIVFRGLETGERGEHRIYY